MCGIFPFYILGLILFNVGECSDASDSLKDIVSFFEYGMHVEGEEKSFEVYNVIQHDIPVYTLNITPYRADFEKRYTYIRVEYISPLSNVEIYFNETTNTLSFYIRYPVVIIPFGVLGYSVKLLRSRVWSSWRKRFRKSNGIQNIQGTLHRLL